MPPRSPSFTTNERERNMKRFLTTAIALTIALSLAATEAEAGRRRVRANRSSRPMFQQRSRGNFFSNMMDLERRKNAWLRSTFLGR